MSGHTSWKQIRQERARQQRRHPFHELTCQRCQVFAIYCPCSRPQLTDEEWVLVADYVRWLDDGGSV